MTKPNFFISTFLVAALGLYICVIQLTEVEAQERCGTLRLRECKPNECCLGGLFSQCHPKPDEGEDCGPNTCKCAAGLTCVDGTCAGNSTSVNGTAEDAQDYLWA